MHLTDLFFCHRRLRGAVSGKTGKIRELRLRVVMHGLGWRNIYTHINLVPIVLYSYLNINKLDGV